MVIPEGIEIDQSLLLAVPSVAFGLPLLSYCSLECENINLWIFSIFLLTHVMAGLVLGGTLLEHVTLRCQSADLYRRRNMCYSHEVKPNFKFV